MNLQNPIYTDDNVAREYLESLRGRNWPICPHRGQGRGASGHEHARPGVCKCRDRGKPFSVTVGIVFERSKIPLSKGLLANDMLGAPRDSPRLARDLQDGVVHGKR